MGAVSEPYIREPIEFEIPVPLPSWNRIMRAHWSEVSELNQRWRILVSTYFPPKKRGPAPPYGISLRIVNYTRRLQDVDNVCVKPLVDALGPLCWRLRGRPPGRGPESRKRSSTNMVAPGWLPDDSPEHVRKISVEPIRCWNERVSVRIEFYSQPRPRRRRGPRSKEEIPPAAPTPDLSEWLNGSLS